MMPITNNGQPEIKTLIMTYPYSLENLNGGAKTAREVPRHLGKLGVRVILLPQQNSLETRPKNYTSPKVQLGVEVVEELSQDNVTVMRLARSRNDFMQAWSVRQAVKELIKRENVQAIMGFYHEAAFLPTLAHAHEIPFAYLSVWQSYAWGLRQGRKRYLLRYLQKTLKNHFLVKSPHLKADLLFAISHFTQNELVDVVGIQPKRIVVCYQGVAPVFASIPRQPAKKIRRIIFFGRIIPSKGVRDALQALGILAAKGIRDWEYHMIGGGDHDWANQVAKEQGISELVSVKAPLFGTALHNELQQAQLALMPSHMESFGLSIAEAQAAGLPVIAYEVGSVPEVVEKDVTAWLAPPHDVAQLAQYIEVAINNPDKAYQMGMDGRARMSAKFTWERTAQAIVDGLANLNQRKAV